MKRARCCWLWMMVGLSGSLYAADAEEGSVQMETEFASFAMGPSLAQSPPPQYESPSCRALFAFNQMKRECLRLLGLYEKKLLTHGFYNALAQGAQHAYAVSTHSQSAVTAAAIEALSKEQFSAIRITFPAMFAQLRKQIEGLDNLAVTEQLAYTVQVLRAFFPKEHVRGALAPEDKQEDGAWLLAHVQDLMARIVAGTSDTQILEALEQQRNALAQRLQVTTPPHLQLEMGTLPPEAATAVVPSLAFRFPAFARHDFRKFWSHGFPKTEAGTMDVSKEKRMLGGAAIVGVFAMFAGMGVLGQRLPRCISCPPGSDHRFSEYMYHCWEEGYDHQSAAPSVTMGWDDACWLRFTLIGAFLTAGPALFPLVFLLAQATLVLGENVLYQTFCLMAIITGVLYGGSEYLYEAGGAGVQACRTRLSDRQRRQHVRAIESQAQRETSALEAQQADLPASENLQKELEILRALIEAFPPLQAIFSQGHSIEANFADQLLADPL